MLFYLEELFMCIYLELRPNSISCNPHSGVVCGSGLGHVTEGKGMVVIYVLYYISEFDRLIDIDIYA